MAAPSPPHNRRAGELRAERDLLRRELLRPGPAPVLPGILLGDRYVPGVQIDDTTWIPDPNVFSPEEVAGLVDGRRLTTAGRRLSEQQWKEWRRGKQEPVAAWEAIAPSGLSIDDLRVILLASPVFDQIAEQHADAPPQAVPLVQGVSQIIAGVQAVRAYFTTSPPMTLPVGVLAASFERLLRLEAIPLWETLRTSDMAALVNALEDVLPHLTAISQVTNAWRPRRSRREQPWHRATRRLAGFLLRSAAPRAPEGFHLALVAALEWHGNDLGRGSLEQKKDRVREALRLRPAR